MGGRRTGGRPSHLPVDRTPFDGAEVDVRARIAWLLRVNRLTGPPDARTLGRFVVLLAERRIVASPATVSRWESGQAEVPLPVLAAYEDVLGLHLGSLQGSVLHLLPDPGEELAVRVPQGRLGRRELQNRLDDVYDRVARPAPTGVDWLELASLLLAWPAPVLPRALSQPLVARLLDEMQRSVGKAFFSRYAALRALVLDPGYYDQVVDAVLDVIADPNAQAVVDAVIVAGIAPSPEREGEFLGLLDHEHWRVRVGAAHALGDLAAARRLSTESFARLARRARTLTSDTFEGRTVPLEQLQQGLRAAAGTPVRRPSVPPPAAMRRIVHEVAARGREQTGIVDDPLLERLVKEAFSASNETARNMALWFIDSSPYREAVAGYAARVVDESPEPAVVRPAWGVLSYLVEREELPWLLGLLADPASPYLTEALTALGHGPGIDPDVDLAELARRATDPAGVWALTNAAGLSGHPVLVEWARDPAMTALRGPATWWLAHGAAVRD